MVTLYHFSISCQYYFLKKSYIKYQKLPLEKEEASKYQPELRNPVAIPLIVV